MSKHTPGPWSVDTKPMDKNSKYMVAEIESEETIVCSVWENGEKETSLANARLISVAPEMYELLNDFILFFNPTTEKQVETIRKAVDIKVKIVTL